MANPHQTLPPHSLHLPSQRPAGPYRIPEARAAALVDALIAAPGRADAPVWQLGQVSFPLPADPTQDSDPAIRCFQALGAALGLDAPAREALTGCPSLYAALTGHLANLATPEPGQPRLQACVLVIRGKPSLSEEQLDHLIAILQAAADEAREQGVPFWTLFTHPDVWLDPLP